MANARRYGDLQKYLGDKGLTGGLAHGFELSKVWGFAKIPRHEKSCWWRVKDLNLRRQSRGIYSPNQGQTLAQHSQISRGK